MIRLGDLRAKHARAMPLELGAHQLHQLRRVTKAIRRAVQRHEPTAAGNVVEQCLGRRRLDLVDVGV